MHRIYMHCGPLKGFFEIMSPWEHTGINNDNIVITIKAKQDLEKNLGSQL